MRWVQDWSLPGLRSFMLGISDWTDTEGRLAVPAIAVLALVLSGRARRAWAIGLAILLVALMSFGFDYALGSFVDRGRPLTPTTGTSFPSAHTFGSTVMFGFIAFLSIRHRLHMSMRAPLLALMAVLIPLVGLSRIFLSQHWPTDVAAGFLLGAILLLILIPLYGLCMRAICDDEEAEPPGLRTAPG